MHHKPRRVLALLTAAVAVVLGSLNAPAVAHAAGSCPVIAANGTPDPLPDRNVDWSGCNLTGINLNNWPLGAANFAGANLTGASMRFTDLTGATLTGANLTGATLDYVTLTGAAAANATFTDVIGAGGVYEHANLAGATFTRTKLTSPDMDSVDLTGATFTDANLEGAHLEYASLRSARIRSSTLRGVYATFLKFDGATIAASNLSHSSLRLSTFKNNSITNTSFDFTNLAVSNIETWTVTGSGNTWVQAVCSDNKPSTTHMGGDCMRDPDFDVPRARPTVTGPGTGVGHWYTGPVTINWNWYDAGVLSPTACTHTSPGVNVAGTVTATCSDLAGHASSSSVDVRFDPTAPSLSATISHAPNGLNGWWRTAPTVSYSCSDSGSGMARCPGPVTAGQGARTLIVTARDIAGNSVTNYTPVKVDTVRPTAAVNLATLNGYGAQVPRCVATDATSGVATCRITTTASSSPNYRYAVAAATDKAGNSTTSARATYRATTTAAVTSAPTRATRGRPLSLVVTSRNAKGALINLAGVRALSPVKTTSTGSGPANTAPGAYASRIATGTYRVTLTAPRTSGYYRFAVRVGTATVTKVIRVL